ncbi:hypothetical protein STEG23_026577, partial [Scotinomys teguina]
IPPLIPPSVPPTFFSIPSSNRHLFLLDRFTSSRSRAFRAFYFTRHTGILYTRKIGALWSSYTDKKNSADSLFNGNKMILTSLAAMPRNINRTPMGTTDQVLTGPVCFFVLLTNGSLAGKQKLTKSMTPRRPMEEYCEDPKIISATTKCSSSLLAQGSRADGSY